MDIEPRIGPSWRGVASKVVVFITVSLLVSACSAGTGNLEDSQPSTTRTTSTIALGSSSVDVPTTSTTALGPTVGWISPSGVPMAVLDDSGNTIEVLTPCGDPTTVSAGFPLYQVDVVLDPGHGGPVDTGAVGANGLAEKEINLKVALATQQVLQARGFAVMLTRSGDYPIPIPTRAEYADRVGARALISIHHNAPVAPASEIPGVEIFVQNEKAESARLGGLLYGQTMDALGRFDVDWDRSPDAGVMTVINPDGLDAYGMVRLPETTSVLLELGYIANRAEAELYMRPEYVPAAAAAIADAVEAFLTTDESGAELVEGRVFRPNSGVGKDLCVDVDLERPLYPSVVDVDVTRGADGFAFSVTMESPYDTPERYADAWRIIGDDGVIYGVRVLLHDHANEQPFTRALDGVSIPDSVNSVTIEGRDLVYGWGGGVFEVELP